MWRGESKRVAALLQEQGIRSFVGDRILDQEHWAKWTEVHRCIDYRANLDAIHMQISKEHGFREMLRPHDRPSITVCWQAETSP